MSRGATSVRKPKALREGATVSIVSVSSPAEPTQLLVGSMELRALGFRVEQSEQMLSQGYFAGGIAERTQDLVQALQSKTIDGLIVARGGYGSSYLLENNPKLRSARPKCLVGYSDLTAVQIFLWQTRRWVTFYGPMVASGFAASSGSGSCYDRDSFLRAVRNTKGHWNLPLRGAELRKGNAEGRVLGGCLTLLQSSLGTPWELDTRDSILLLEDRGMKPYQVDRALLHLRQAGKFAHVRGIVLGDFPDCDPPVPGGPTVRDICERLLTPLGIPVVYGAPVGHTMRPMLTIPLGIKARLTAKGTGTLEFLEPAVID